MMPGYIYLPVPTREMRDFARAWNDGLHGKGKLQHRVLANPFVQGWRKGLARRLGPGCLARVAPDDKLYVLAHGNANGSRAIGARRGTGDDTLKAYGPVELARVLESEGLTKQFENLRIFACGSGLAPVDDPEMGPFAHRLRHAMLERGYDRVRVTGYLGAAKTSYAYRQHIGSADMTDERHKGVEIVNESGGVSIVRAKDARITFSDALDD